MITVNEQSELALGLEQIDKKLFNMLYPYQLACIATMENLERTNETHVCDNEGNITGKMYTHYGILANPVGSGKTLIALGLISLFNEFRKPIKDSILNGVTDFIGDKLWIKKYGIDILTNILPSGVYAASWKKCTVILVPDTLEKQWTTELKKTRLRFTVITGKFLRNNTSLLDNNGGTFIEAQFSNTVFDDTDVILCKSGNYPKFAKASTLLVFNRLIIDEIDTITKSNSKLTISDFTWFISGTPNALDCEKMGGYFEYNKRMSASLIDLLSVKCDYSFIKKVNCTVNKHTIRCKVSAALSSIQKYVPQQVWARINADDTESAMELLGGTVFTIPSFIERITSTMNFEIVNNKNEMTTISQNGLLSSVQKREKIVALEKKNCSINARLDAIKEAVSATTNICPVCMEDTDSPVITDCCKNLYCIRCITTLAGLADHRCPTCRLALDLEKMCLISSTSKEIKKVAETVPDLKEKKQELKDLVTKIDSLGPNKKILIFSDYIGTFNTIDSVLQETGVSFVKAMTKGGSLTRKIEEYNTATTTKVLLMLSEEHARGLNLEKTTDIIIYHSVNQSTETQIIGRAMRLSRDPELELNIWYLVNEAETEN